jgi:rfaE bifunctional protein nucleotidyltransferase chain/domain
MKTRGKDKIIPVSKLRQFASKLSRSRKKVVFTNGVFDILHAGHADYLEKSAALGDVLVIGLNTDSSVKKNKGSKRPIIPYRHRARMLAALECVDFVVPLAAKTPQTLIEMIRPAVLVKGADYKLTEIVGADFVRQIGGKVVRMRLVPELSTSQIIKKIGALKGK